MVSPSLTRLFVENVTARPEAFFELEDIRGAAADREHTGVADHALQRPVAIGQQRRTPAARRSSP
jgi:hypothetical protein